MSKKKYKYNPKTLSYEEVKKSWGQKIVRSIIFLAPSILIGLGLAFVFEHYFESPKEKKLKRDLSQSSAVIQDLKDQTDLIIKTAKITENKNNAARRVLFADPVDYSLDSSVLNTGNRRYDDIPNSDLIKRTARSINEAYLRVDKLISANQDLVTIAKEKEERLAAIPAIQPVANKDLTRMASGFGWRIDPVYKTRRMHAGMDFTADTGTDIYVTGDGTVVEAEYNSGGYGQCVVVDHGFGYRTRYAHMSKIKVRKGQKVKRGEILGLVGSTGKSTGPHLHYEVEVRGVKVNPINFYYSDLTPEQYAKLLEMSNNTLESFD